MKFNKAINLSCNSRHEGVEGGGSMPLNFPRLHPVVHSVEGVCQLCTLCKCHQRLLPGMLLDEEGSYV